RLYDRDHPGPALKSVDFNAFLELDSNSPETDLEAGARIGDRAFWIGSFGRNRAGKFRENRCRLFATDIQVRRNDVTLVAVGRPYKFLVEALEADPRFAD